LGGLFFHGLTKPGTLEKASKAPIQIAWPDLNKLFIFLTKNK
jgi:hypothetical protein